MDDPRYHELPFDATQWKEERYVWRENANPNNRARMIAMKMSEGTQRAHMAGDLTKNHLRQGMSQEEVERLLGPREDRDGRGNDWVYRFSIKGFEDNLRWDDSGSHFIIIRFNEEGKYIGYEIIVM